MARSVLASLLIFAVAMQLPAARAATGPSWVERLTQRALDGGASATLPPNLSEVLALTKSGTATPVRQLVVREGRIVRTFNVVGADHRKVVLLRVDEFAHAATALLVSPRGTLRKSVAYQAGESAHEVSAKDADFDGERRFWSARADGAH